MTWRSLQLWFLRFRKSYYPDVVVIYKNYLYDKWFNSLSEEEQKTEIERQRRLKEKRKRDGERAMMQFLYLESEIRRIASRNLNDVSYFDLVGSIF